MPPVTRLVYRLFERLAFPNPMSVGYKNIPESVMKALLRTPSLRVIALMPLM